MSTPSFYCLHDSYLPPSLRSCITDLFVGFSGYFDDDILTHFIASMISGFVTTVASLPLDIAKTRWDNTVSFPHQPRLLSRPSPLYRLLLPYMYTDAWLLGREWAYTDCVGTFPSYIFSFFSFFSSFLFSFFYEFVFLFPFFFSHCLDFFILIFSLVPSVTCPYHLKLPSSYVFPASPSIPDTVIFCMSILSHGTYPCFSFLRIQSMKMIDGKPEYTGSLVSW